MLNPPESPQSPINAEIVESREEQVSLEESVSWLSDSERAALEVFKRNFKKGGLDSWPLSPDAAIQFFSLYLQGRSLTEIVQLNPQYSLGTIVSSAVDGRWDLKYKEYLEDLYTKARNRVVQSAAEGVGFIADLLAVTHIKDGTKLKKFIQTEDPEHLKGGNFEIQSLRQYKEAVEVLMKLTGQDNIKKVQFQNQPEQPQQAAIPESTKPEPQALPSLGDLVANRKKLTGKS
jgi:hypothetical protein